MGTFNNQIVQIQSCFNTVIPRLWKTGRYPAPVERELELGGVNGLVEGVNPSASEHGLMG